MFGPVGEKRGIRDEEPAAAAAAAVAADAAFHQRMPPLLDRERAVGRERRPRPRPARVHNLRGEREEDVE
jgi:hypothetical protein